MDIKEFIDEMRSDPAGISAKYGIPLRTVYGWYNGSRKPPVYVLTMMSDINILERRLKAYGDSKEGLEEGIREDISRIKEACKES